MSTSRIGIRRTGSRFSRKERTQHMPIGKVLNNREWEKLIRKIKAMKQKHSTVPTEVIYLSGYKKACDDVITLLQEAKENK
jgi:hypothetical protein